MEQRFANNGYVKRPFSSYHPNVLTSNGSGEGKKMKFTRTHNNSPMKHSNIDTTAIEVQRKGLPVYQARIELINHIQQNKTLILIGETACGKTTQIPQFIFEEEMHDDGIIGVTQPRRVAATTLADRVAQEMKTALGDLVGYCIRFEDVTTAHTKVKFMTDGMLLREAILDNKLLAYSVIILDEAHERTIHTDVLFGIVKKAQDTRQRERLKPLKVIIMSATMDVGHFSNYFDSAPVIYLEGRQHNVQIFHSIQCQEDYVFSSIVTVFQIHKEAPANEDILVFLTGQDEIESMAQSIRTIAKEMQSRAPPLKVFPLYSSLPTGRMQQVFKSTPQGFRKVVLSTNVAETSVTIPGIKYVIDTGKFKCKVHHPGSGLDTLKVQRISRAQAWQRSGRAGREAPGICYRLFTKEEFSLMPEHTQPELLRCNLSAVTLQLFALGIDITNFDFIDKPSPESIESALQELKLLEAIDSDHQLTALGEKMAKFPIDPRYSKILLSTEQYDCGQEIVILIAVLSGETIFVTPPTKRDEAREAHLKFLSSGGDLITIIQIFRAYNKIPQSNLQSWCSDNFLHCNHLLQAAKVRKQLMDMSNSMGIKLKSCGQDFDKVRKCLVTGLFMNVAELQRDKKYFTIGTRQKVTLHPSSVLSGSYPAFVLFTEMVQTSKPYIRNLSLVDSDWLTELAPEYFRQHRVSGV